jgi:putative SOS response-associated peptidase YedK
VNPNGLIVEQGLPHEQDILSEDKATVALSHPRPYHFRRIDGKLLGFAGLWERWKDADGQPVETRSIITTAANAILRLIDDRMPVILDPADYGQWLDLRAGADDLRALLRPAPDETLTGIAVSNYVSNARHQ